MAESLDCPKCGAPVDLNTVEQSDAGTIKCPYCGETVVLPKGLRKRRAPQTTLTGEEFRQKIFQVASNETPGEARKKANRSMAGCLAVGVITALAVVAYIVLIVFKGPATHPASASQKDATDPMLTQASMFMQAATQIVEAVKTSHTLPPPTIAVTRTPRVNIAATEQADREATQTVQSTLAAEQAGWPVLLQEKFANNRLNWTTGSSNDALAVEDFTIAKNQYTWQVTSKKSMGTFSFPDMADQSDVYVSVDLQVTASSENPDDQAGIVFRRLPDDSSFYFFGVSMSGVYSLSFYDGSSWYEMITNTETTLLDPQGVNHLAVSMQGDQILLMINDSVVDSFEDTRLTSGGAGLGINLGAPGEDVSLVFSNFSVRAPKK
jgi:hypothetical protein